MTDESSLWRGKVPQDIRRPDRLPPAQLERLAANVDTDLKATWWMQQTPGTTYWRGTVPAKYLPGQVLSLTTADLKRNGDRIVVPRQRSLTAIWQFPGSGVRGILMRALQVAGFRVLVEVDDNYFLTTTHQQRLIAEGRSSWQKNLDLSGEDKHSIEAHRRICEFADGIIVTTETLAEAYREVNDNVYVCRNSIDLADWPVPQKRYDGVFRIGYAASASHLYDAADIERALSWAAAQPGVEVWMYGLSRDWSFPHKQVPWTTNLAQYRRSLQALDVGLCPLRASGWTDCKSDVKVLEHSMAGAMSIVARRPPYAEWHDTDLALTADTPKDFLRHVKWCVQNQDGVRAIAKDAKQKIINERLIDQEIAQWRQAVGF